MLCDFESYMLVMGNLMAISREVWLNHNLNKLLKGDRARYTKGEYSDEQANARADKQEADNS